MQIESLQLIKTAMKCAASTNPNISNSFDTAISWFIANNGFRATEDLTVPDPVAEALRTLKEYPMNPMKYPDVAVADAPEAA